MTHLSWNWWVLRLNDAQRKGAVIAQARLHNPERGGFMTPPPALLLAAGRGERMRPLTDHTPKPLLKVSGKPLLQWHVEALRAEGVARLVVNTAWLAPKVHAFFERLETSNAQEPGRTAESLESARRKRDIPGGGAGVLFSDEQRDFGHALETAGGISRALPLLFPKPSNEQPEMDVFWVIAGDVFVPTFSFDMQKVEQFMATDCLAHLWLVPNPPHHPDGDFGVSENGMALNFPLTEASFKRGCSSCTKTPNAETRYTFGSIGLFRASLFESPWLDIPRNNPEGCSAPLAPVLRRAIDAGRVGAEIFRGEWTDVGTPERLSALNQRFLLTEPHSGLTKCLRRIAR